MQCSLVHQLAARTRRNVRFGRSFRLDSLQRRKLLQWLSLYLLLLLQQRLLLVLQVWRFMLSKSKADLSTSLDIINVVVVNNRDSNDKDTHLADCGMDDPWRNVEHRSSEYILSLSV